MTARISRSVRDAQAGAACNLAEQRRDTPPSPAERRLRRSGSHERQTKRLMRMQKTEIAFEAEGGAQPRLAGKSFLRSENDAGPVPRLAGVDRDVSPAQTVRFMRARWGLFLAASLFQRKAPPLASVDVRPISVEIMRADKLSALAKRPSETGSTINSVAAQEERQEAVKPEATRKEEKVADVSLSASRPVENHHCDSWSRNRTGMVSSRMDVKARFLHCLGTLRAGAQSRSPTPRGTAERRII